MVDLPTLLKLCVAQCFWQMLIVEGFSKRIGEKENDQLR